MTVLDGPWPHAEMPRCDGCGHRRIRHYTLTRGGRGQKGGRGRVAEVEVPCSMPDCKCAGYRTRWPELIPPWGVLPGRSQT